MMNAYWTGVQIPTGPKYSSVKEMGREWVAAGLEPGKGGWCPRQLSADTISLTWDLRLYVLGRR